MTIHIPLPDWALFLIVWIAGTFIAGAVAPRDGYGIAILFSAGAWTVFCFAIFVIYLLVTR